MGCANQKQAVVPERRADTPKGVLDVNLISAHLTRDTAVMLKMDPYASLSMNTQKHLSKVAAKAGFDPVYNQTFRFFINSDRTTEGRSLQVGIWDKNTVTDKEIGFGIVDLDPVIKQSKQKAPHKCYINYNRQAVGYVLLQLSFKQELKGVLYMEVHTASIRRKTSTFSDMKCQARVTVGEDVEETSIKKDTKDSPPVWNQAFRLTVIESSMTGKLEIWDGSSLVGTLALQISKFVQALEPKECTQELHYENANAGTVTFSACFLSLEGVPASDRNKLIEDRQVKLIEIRKVKAEQKLKQEQQKAAKLKQQQALLEKKRQEQQEAKKKQEEEAKKKQQEQANKAKDKPENKVEKQPEAPASDKKDQPSAA